MWIVLPIHLSVFAPRGPATMVFTSQNAYVLRGIAQAYERRRQFITKNHAGLVFQACISFFKYFRTSGTPTMKIIGHVGMLPCLVPSWLKLCKFVARSDLVLISFWMLTIPGIFYPISFYRRASRFVVFETKWRTSVFALFAKKCRCTSVAEQGVDMSGWSRVSRGSIAPCWGECGLADEISCKSYSKTRLPQRWYRRIAWHGATNWENSTRLWLCSGSFGGSRGKLRESPGKIAGKFFPNREMLQVLGFRAPGKANLPGTLKVDTAWTLSPPSVRGVFWNRQFQPSREFFWLTTKVCPCRPVPTSCAAVLCSSHAFWLNGQREHCVNQPQLHSDDLTTAALRQPTFGVANVIWPWLTRWDSMQLAEHRASRAILTEQQIFNSPQTQLLGTLQANKKKKLPKNHSNSGENLRKIRSKPRSSGELLPEISRLSFGGCLMVGA